MSAARKRTPAVLFFGILATAVSLPSSVLAYDPWPLVKEAESVAWGTLTDIVDGDEDRLLMIEVTGGADGRVSRGPVSVRLLERAGRYPEGTPLRIGASGIFLYGSAVDESGEFGSVDGWLITGGYLPAEASEQGRALFARLYSSISPISIETSTDSTTGTSTEASSVTSGTGIQNAFLAARDMLGSTDPCCRGLGLSWLKRNPIQVDARIKLELADRFNREMNPHLQRAYMELFLLRGWALAGERPAQIVIAEQRSDVVETALTYIENHGTMASKAELLQAYPDVDLERQRILLLAYGRLQIQEAGLWWRQALLSGDARHIRASLRGMALAESPGCEQIYKQLLASKSPKVQRLALQGLATLATVGARDAIRDLIDRSTGNDPIEFLARKVLATPHRYGIRHLKNQRIDR